MICRLVDYAPSPMCGPAVAALVDIVDIGKIEIAVVDSFAFCLRSGEVQWCSCG